MTQDYHFMTPLLALIFTPQTTKKALHAYMMRPPPDARSCERSAKTRTGMWDGRLALSKFLSKDAEVLCENSFS